MPNLEQFLQPITPENPSGEDMGFSTEFDSIKQARESDDPKLEQGDWETDLREADWGLVSKTSEKLLSQKTKDLRVVGWLIEGWTKTRGFAGFADGFEVLGGVCKNFWDTLHPRVEEGDDEDELRAGNVAWIVNNSMELAKTIPLTRTEGGVFGFLHWEAAMKLANDIKRSPDEAVALSRNRLTVEEFNTARANTPATFYADLHQQVMVTRQNLDKLTPILDECLGRAAPSLTPIKQLLSNIYDLVRRFARDAGVLLEDEKDEKPESEEKSEESGEKRAAIGGAIASRKQALDQLRAIALYFRETEPHSPVAYLAEKAAAWGNLPLHMWLKAVVKNNESLAKVEELLGIETPEEKK